MDNEKLEIVTNEEAMAAADVVKPDLLKTYGPVAAGVLAGGLIGFVVCKFGPKLIAKFKKTSDENKSEE